MARKAINIRFPEELLARVDTHADATGTTRTSILEEGAERVLGGKKIVPDDEAAQKALKEADKRAKDAIDHQYRNGDKALIQQRSQKHRPFMSKRNADALALQELIQEGKLHA